MATKKIAVAEVIRSGEAITVPPKMQLKTAAEILIRQAEYEDQKISIIESFAGFYQWDTCRAFYRAMQEVFGFAGAKGDVNLFGQESPPKEVTIKTGPRRQDSETVPYGGFMIPLIDGTVAMGARNGELIVQVDCKRKWEAKVKELVEKTYANLERDSIYRGKAVRIQYHDASLPEIDFMGLAECDLILPRKVEHALQASIWTPIENAQECREMQIPLKRAILLHGTYGTGKTLAANVTAAKAAKHGWTFVYASNAGDLAQAYNFAMSYAPAVLFVEDCDRSLSGIRNANIDTILNTVDGIDTKGAEVLLVMTTNNADRIPNAMRRPGRIDACIEITAPDAEAVGRLLQHYSRGRLEGNTEQAQHLLAGQIPAVIRETVERAKLYAIHAGRDKVTGDDINLSAESMVAQVRFINAEQQHAKTHAEIVADALSNVVINDEAVNAIADRVYEMLQ